MSAHVPPWARNLLFLACLLFSVLPTAISRSTVHAQAAASHRVIWDAHSLLIDGHRVLLYSGEFHYWRLPSPELWSDRLEKMKAAGLNSVSIYFDWQYHSWAPGQYDFSGVRDVDRLLSIADRLGIYVLARVGPYMNAEADAGGLPGWLLRQQLFPRAQSWNGSVAAAADSPLYAQYSKEWFDHILPIVARHQVTNGGSVALVQIENEYSQDQGSAQYMHELYDYARSDGITVPIFHNDYWFKGDWSKLVDLYAYDSYPYGFQCCHQWWDTHFHGIDTWEQTLRESLKITTPMFVSELQGGAFDPWGGKGYDAVASTLDGDWLNALDQSVLAQGATLVNTYMFAGGTSWGYMSEPGVYTSYDYGAPISESGALRPGYFAAHRLGTFLQSFGPELAATDRMPSLAQTTNPHVVVHSRADAQTGEEFFFLRHGDPGAPEHTHLRLAVGNSQVKIPQQPRTFISLPGHSAALLVANSTVGPLHLNYSTSQVLTNSSTEDGQYLVLYGADSTPGETDFAIPQGAGARVVHNADVQVTEGNGELRLNYLHTSEPRTISIQVAGGTLHVLITTISQASRYWVVNNMIIAGPDLVTSSGDKLSLQMSKGRGARVYGAPADRPLIVDGRIAGVPDQTMGCVLLGGLQAEGPLRLPALSSWRYHAEAPEIEPGFDDSGWQLANHASTLNPNVPATDTLLADDYGFHYGYVWYRGHFTGTGNETGINLSARQSYSVFINGDYAGSANESLKDAPHDYALTRSFTFPEGAVRVGQDNVVSVLTESLGHDEGWLAGPVAESPQGILTAALTNDTPVTWRIQGAQGGENPPDRERGLLNASGLFGERAGWYLPRYDDAAWQSVSVPDDWKARGIASPIGWYRTHFFLDENADGRSPIGLNLPHVSDKATIWLNGWLIGRYWEQRGPQHLFYLPDGILNRRGDNVLAIAVWNRGHHGGLTAVPTLSQYPSLLYHAVHLRPATTAAAEQYWHTDGSRIVDSDGRPVRLAAVNWFGMENRWFVPAGLDKQPLDVIMGRIQALGFNGIRLPFSNQMVEENPVVDSHLDANPDLKGLHALDIMDRVVASARAHHLRVVLDDGRSSVGTQPQGNGLWYTQRYPETAWIADWQLLVRRYLNDPTVVGVDLRNEPHTGPPGPWSVKTYLHQGATWGPYHGIENESTDWRLGAQRGGNAVLAINPHLLVIVEGIQQYPNPSWPDGIESYWWGGILYPAAQYPVQLDVPHQLVYSPHEYGPIKWQMPFFGPRMTYASVAAVWDQHWGFLERESPAGPVPIFIGEFGTCGTTRACVADATPGSQGLWFSFLMRYLKTHPEISWSYWALNGTNHRGDPTPDYLLGPDWTRVTMPRLVNTLRDVELGAPPAP